MNRLTLLLGTGMGVGLMYLLDPKAGPQRRAQLSDQLNQLMTDRTGETRAAMMNDMTGAVGQRISDLASQYSQHVLGGDMQGNPELEHWTPSIRMVVGAAGGLLALNMLRRRNLFGFMSGLVGSTLLARAISDKPVKRLVGLSNGKGTVEVRKSININAPIERVFETWTYYENFPHFMSHVREVKEIEQDRSRWTVTGPAGVPVQWDAVLTAYEPNRVVAWETVPGSIVQHSGRVEFRPNPDGTTHVTVHMMYNPGIGELGHGIAKMLGVDPKQQMDEDLARMKTFVETGNVPPGAAEESQEQPQTTPQEEGIH
jgi:uncharacterized membrane protein